MRIRSALRPLLLSLVLATSLAPSLGAAQSGDPVRDQLEQVRGQKEFYSRQQSELGAAAETSEADIAALEASLAKRRQEVAEANAKVEEVAARLAKLKEQRGQAMRQSYITGQDLSYLYALLNSGSLSEFLSKGQYTTFLLDRKSRLVDTVDEQIESLDRARRDLVTRKNAAEAEAAALEKKLREIREAIERNRAQLAAASALEASLLALTGDHTAQDCRRPGGDSASDRFTLAGSGTEHGLGMSQYGAKGAADRGRNYREILSHYYLGTSIGDVGSFQTNQGESESYLVGVVEAEMNSNWPMEALKAQAVTARSYAYQNRHRLDNTPATQAWVGSHLQTERARQAVRETRGQVVTYGGQVVAAYFHSTSGGCTENNENVWGGTPLGWLRGVSSPWETESPHWNWSSKTYSRAEMQAILGRDSRTSVGELQSVRIVGRGVSGRVTAVEVQGSAGTKRVSGPTFKRIFNSFSPSDEPGLRSTLFGFK